MYQTCYDEVIEDASQTVRASERAAILQTIRLLERAEAAGPRSREAIEALLFSRRLWEFFLEHLASTDNPLPEKLRAELISIGISLLKQVERLQRGETDDLASLREISQTIAEGLS
jgi:flagellar biosynthesis activator protein FlaF